MALEWFVRRSMKVWYARARSVTSCHASFHPLPLLPFSRAFHSVSLAASSSFLKSLVFCARSFLWTVESRWWATISEAVLSRFETSVVKSRSTICRR
jgi:hypothetical protein